MNNAITEKTEEFLLACKDAGYEKVTIFVHDKRVPDSCMIRKTSTGWDADEDGMWLNPETDEMEFRAKPGVPGSCWGTYWGLGKRNQPFKVVCGYPQQRCAHPTLEGKEGPAMWKIVYDLGNL